MGTDGGLKRRDQPRETHGQKNREMKEGPTILLITKGLLWEPTMLMKTKDITRISHDILENKQVNCSLLVAQSL